MDTGNQHRQSHRPALENPSGWLYKLHPHGAPYLLPIAAAIGFILFASLPSSRIPWQWRPKAMPASTTTSSQSSYSTEPPPTPCLMPPPSSLRQPIPELLCLRCLIATIKMPVSPFPYQVPTFLAVEAFSPRRNLHLAFGRSTRGHLHHHHVHHHG